MSGGNHYAVSHFAAAAKWFFGWIPDSSVIRMQPEGTTPECPTCLGEGSFRLLPFDDKDLPPTPDRKMAVHVPIAYDGDRTLFSFWLSYRGAGNGGMTARGLSVHFTTFLLREHMYGSEYDSHRYFAKGSTADKREAVVMVGTCYDIHPSSYMKDRDLMAAFEVRPVVCVDAVDEGSSIDISVSFLDGDGHPPEQGGLAITTLDCSGGSSAAVTVNYTLDANDSHLIHVVNTGYDGNISMSLCTDGESPSGVQATGFLYDEYVHLCQQCTTTLSSPVRSRPTRFRHLILGVFCRSYPVSPLAYDSEPSYGSFKSVQASPWQCCAPGTTLTATTARVVVVKQNKSDFLHLNEIEIFDVDGNNVAREGSCYSSSVGWDENGVVGNPVSDLPPCRSACVNFPSKIWGPSTLAFQSCLNDGATGTYPETCNSRSTWLDINNFDYCVLSESVDIARIKIWPFNDPSSGWMTERLDDLLLSVYADVRGQVDFNGQNRDAQFLGELYTTRLEQVFRADQREPRSFDGKERLRK